MAALRAPYMDRWIHEVTSTMARLGDGSEMQGAHSTQVHVVPPPPTPKPASARMEVWWKKENGAAPSLLSCESEQQTDVV